MEEPLKARPNNLFLSNKVEENNNNINKNPVQVQEVQSPLLSQNLLQGQNSNNSFFSNQHKQGSAVKGLDTVFSFNFDNVQPSSHLSIQKSENQVKNFNLQENNSNNNNNQSKFVIQQQPPSFKFQQQQFQIQTSRKSSLNFDLFGQNNDLEQNQKSLKQLEDENLEKYFQQENDKNDLSFDECMFREYQQSFNNQNNNLQKQQQFQFFNQETDFEFKIESQVENTNQNQLFVKKEQTLTNYNNNNNNSQIFQQQGVEEQENNLEIEFPPLDISNEQQEEDTETQSNQNINNHNNINMNFNNNQEIFSSQNNENFNTSSTTLNTYTNFNDQEYDNKGKKLGNQMENIWKVNEKKIAKNKKKQRDYDKNICRYLARQVIRCFVDSVYKEDVIKFCEEEMEFQKNKNLQKENNNNKYKNLSLEDLYQSAKLFLLGKIEFVTGHRAFQDLLICREEEEKFLEKNVFKRFAQWFLKYRALRYIINGAMSDKKGYLQFKNQIMLHYVQKPETWNANLAKKSKRKPKIFRIELA
ncbi:hypothetical protein PPERSA_03678 [Pseudocohnilembus persalinus]|uniref:Uncharacterized protein n=1 Tax=Pseudocohnilembus persalinus TaxID=266149 RepID=A0A0V0QG23_PSEPJ|nr:hypothetical protein PPERSA_03678 [Pseudocohnilembus persalinus]|eukprot:KRX01174.1 hypothetical protein PPERSA_03678 [Pseudocohnilembus persalinus]